MSIAAGWWDVWCTTCNWGCRVQTGVYYLHVLVLVDYECVVCSVSASLTQHIRSTAPHFFITCVRNWIIALVDSYVNTRSSQAVLRALPVRPSVRPSVCPPVVPYGLESKSAQENKNWQKIGVNVPQVKSAIYCKHGVAYRMLLKVFVNCILSLRVN